MPPRRRSSTWSCSSSSTCSACRCRWPRRAASSSAISSAPPSASCSRDERAAMIEVANLKFGWPRAGHDCVVIDALTVPDGSTLFLHGPSGGGKSTLLGLLAGVLLPRAGDVRVLGTSWAALSGARRDAFRADHVGYIFQQFNLLPYLSVLDNVLLPCRFSALRRQRAAHDAGSAPQKARALLARVGLA